MTTLTGLRRTPIHNGRPAWRRFHGPEEVRVTEAGDIVVDIRDMLDGEKAAKCTGRQIDPGETDFGTIKPATAARWHAFANGSLTPADVHPGSPRLVYFTCLCDRPYKSAVRYMRVDRYCRTCTDELRRWAKEQGMELEQLSTGKDSELSDVPDQAA